MLSMKMPSVQKISFSQWVDYVLMLCAIRSTHLTQTLVNC